MEKLGKLLLVLTFIFLWVNRAGAQTSLMDDKNNKKAEVNDLVNGKRYTFEATKAIMPKGGSNALKAGYDLDVSKDTLIANLPYTNEVQAGEISSGKGGIKFTCAHFNYQAAQRKNGAWRVTIEPDAVAKNNEDMKGVQKLTMNISPLGYTTVTITGSNHAPVSYYGYIKAPGAEFPPVKGVH